MTSEALRPADVGQVLAGRYRLVDRVRPDDDAGVSLWQATDEVLGRRVAVHLHEPGGPAARHLLTAAMRAGRVNHPGLANVFDAGDAVTYAYVVSEWVDGTPLSHQLLREGVPSDEQVVATLWEVSSAIAAAHREGVVHGRLTADRVLVSEAGVRVTGIGFARDGASERDDLQALGALLYALITGYWPLPGPTALPHVQPVRTSEPGETAAPGIPEPRSVAPEAPVDLEELALRILQPADHRGVPITSAAALGSVLATWPWTTPSAPPPANFWTRRIAVAAFLLTAALVGWAIGTIIGTVPERDGLEGTPPDSSHASPTPTPAASPNPSPAPPTPVPISSAAAFDPDGDDRENDGSVPLAYDANPDTAWYTESYHSRSDFAGLKPGVGLLVDLGRPADVREITLRLATPGISLQVRAADEPGATIDDYSLVAQSTTAPEDVTMSLPASVMARYWVVWITDLVPGGTSGTQYRAGIAEMTFAE